MRLAAFNFSLIRPIKQRRPEWLLEAANVVLRGIGAHVNPF
jgi:hypothetical protein